MARMTQTRWLLLPIIAGMVVCEVGEALADGPINACKDNVVTVAEGYNYPQVVCLRMFQLMTQQPANAAAWYIDAFGGIHHLEDVHGARCYTMTAPVWKFRLGAFSTATFSHVWVFPYDQREGARAGDSTPPQAAPPAIPAFDPCLPAGCPREAEPPLTAKQRKAGYGYTCYWRSGMPYAPWLLTRNGAIWDRKLGKWVMAP